MHKISVFLIFSLISHELLSQSADLHLGGRSLGLANASVTLMDEWSIINNVAGIHGLAGPIAGIGSKYRYNLPELSGVYMVAVLPWQEFGLGINIYRIGDELYSEHKIGLGIAHKAGFVKLGAKVNYYQIRAEGFGQQGNLVFEFGGIAEMLPWLSFAAHIYNLNQARLLDYADERVPVVMKAGFALKPEDNLSFLFEGFKDLSQPVQWRAGLEYSLSGLCILRTGVQHYPRMPFFGIGFRAGQFAFDYGFGAGWIPGQIHEFTVSCNFVKGQ
ncbi:MAG: hypothetical protein JJU28_16935 [Cyclobacteriaceae bacterium]|nr:hypothetical protein [Cyclobacteriaceae bacterium]